MLTQNIRLYGSMNDLSGFLRSLKYRPIINKTNIEAIRSE
jgi:hypothetical protein